MEAGCSKAVMLTRPHGSGTLVSEGDYSMSALTIAVPPHLVGPLQHAAAERGQTPEQLAVAILTTVLTGSHSDTGGGRLDQGDELMALVERFRSGIAASG